MSLRKLQRTAAALHPHRHCQPACSSHSQSPRRAADGAAIHRWRWETRLGLHPRRRAEAAARPRPRRLSLVVGGAYPLHALRARNVFRTGAASNRTAGLLDDGRRNLVGLGLHVTAPAERRKGTVQIMTDDERRVVRAVLRALDVPRDRFGRLNGALITQEDLRQEWLRFHGAEYEPVMHGAGRDVIDQIIMVLKCLLLSSRSG